jgi:hypothetical protein
MWIMVVLKEKEPQVINTVTVNNLHIRVAYYR